MGNSTALNNAFDLTGLCSFLHLHNVGEYSPSVMTDDVTDVGAGLRCGGHLTGDDGRGVGDGARLSA